MGQDAENVTIIVEDSLLETSQPPSTIDGKGAKNLKLQHLSVATCLILTYFTEVGIQIFLTVYCCRSLISTQKWDWAWMLTISLGVSSLLVSAVSIVWVWRGLDFAGRLCGRLLCYVMHFFLLGLVWRYLKLAFAYDHADVQEFVALRIFQAHIQSLPLTSIHLAWLITFRENWTNLTLWLVAIEAVSVAIALILASYIKATPEGDESSHLPLSYTNQRFLDNLICSTKELEEEESVMWCRVLSVELNILSRALLLSARLLVIGILIAYLHFWAVLFVLVHFLLTSSWICIRENRREFEGNVPDLIKRSLATSCVLFWDSTSTLAGRISLWTWVIPALLLMAENVGLVLLHYHRAPGELFVIITTGTCLIVGTLLFVALNLLSLPQLSEIFGPKEHQKEIPSESKFPDYSDEFEKVPPAIQDVSPPLSQIQISALIKSSSEITKERSLGKSNSSISANNYTIIREVMRKEGSTRSKDKSRREGKKSPLVGQRQRAPIPHPTWVPDTCCNDSNGSSNSRNTNTIPESTNVLPGDSTSDNLFGTHFVFCYPQQARGHVHDHSRLPSRPKKVQSLTRTQRPSRISPTMSVNVKLRTASPVEIKSASRVIMKHPRHSSKVRETGSRCPCRRSSPAQNHFQHGPDPHQRLLEDSYGILICEGDEHDTPHRSSDRPKSANPPLPSIFHVNKRLRVLCAKCFQNHDPLLTDCLEDTDLPVVRTPLRIAHPLPSETTDYPSETEMTWTAQADDQISLSSHHSTVTDTRWHHTHKLSQHLPNQSYSSTMRSTMISSGSQKEFPKEFTSREYVRTWLLTSQARQQFQHQQHYNLEMRPDSRSRTASKPKKVHVVSTSVTLPTRRRNSDSYRKGGACATASNRKGRFQDPEPVPCPTEQMHSVSDDEGCEVSPPSLKRTAELSQSVIPYQIQSFPLLQSLTQQTIYENGLTEQTLQMFYKDLEILV